MPTKKRYWRIIPPPGIEHQVEDMARREGRSLANMMVRLIGEALDARRLAAKSQNKDLASLVAMLTAPASAPATAE